MHRDEAIRLLCEADLARLTARDRGEQLEIMQCEDWESHPHWQSLPADVRQQFSDGAEIRDPAAKRYEPVLMIWLATTYTGATNAYLLQRLGEAGYQARQLTGSPERLAACPCCGYRTLAEPAAWGICPVCWWEDDGQDNEDASAVGGGPNGALSLTVARWNFLRTGISDPSREDLHAQQQPPAKYERGRFFELHARGRAVREPASGWSGSVPDDQP
jgi:hypothetical protein